MAAGKVSWPRALLRPPGMPHEAPVVARRAIGQRLRVATRQSLRPRCDQRSAKRVTPSADSDWCRAQGGLETT
ncbi:MAG TPA: hypothetical protein DCY47_15260 [Candidatus Accumulibacter sp.]|nr:hypothetical protein [Accumulibacter sp.]